jgi:hypothetical protein
MLGCVLYIRCVLSIEKYSSMNITFSENFPKKLSAAVISKGKVKLSLHLNN